MLDTLSTPVAAGAGDAVAAEAAAEAAPEAANVAADVVTSGGRDGVRVRGFERVRYRPGTREARRLVGNRKDRMAFLELLARHGDPAVAADELGLPLFVLFRHRDADPAFAAEWLAAVNYAWERVESRVLAALLGQAEAADRGGAADAGAPARRRPPAMAAQIDTRLALAIVNRRDRPVTHASSARASDGAAAARLRAELRALAGLTDAS